MNPQYLRVAGETFRSVPFPLTNTQSPITQPRLTSHRILVTSHRSYAAEGTSTVYGCFTNFSIPNPSGIVSTTITLATKNGTVCPI
jgi:hypothetical protein